MMLEDESRRPDLSDGRGKEGAESSQSNRLGDGPTEPVKSGRHNGAGYSPGESSMVRSATFSADGTKRFELIRDWTEELSIIDTRTINFLMLNPSTADGIKDDPTIRKCVGFAKRWGFSRIVITNLIPVISTDPEDLPFWNGIDQENWEVVTRWLRNADLAIAAWGSQPKHISRRVAFPEYIYALKVLSFLPKIHCIGLTGAGQPLHPSRAAYTNRPIRCWLT